MSSEQKKTGRLALLALAGLVAIAAFTGYYWFEAGGRKAGPAAPSVQTPATPAVAGGVSPSLATGALAAFLVRPDRKLLPDIQFQDGSGKPLTLSGWKGRVVLINLWATWCAPCRKEMPDLSRLQAELGSDQFEVVAISVDRKGADASSSFLKETGADNLRLYVEPSTRIVGELQSAGLPATILVDRQGREIGRLLGPADWASPEAIALIKAALAEPG
ncbi:TlpA family protein disulfide reductase [Aestuariivirga sp.]|jgi:thiol-disulfide isomerase/thioredoxin|uniref:TlpA family protein disulfide reductase n=1 Tax=Aestuariivirga sp. TaxID=2650926 RepID=UPI003783F3A9